MLAALATKFLGATARKALTSGLSAVAGSLVGPEILGAFQSGVADALTPQAHQAGVVVGTALGLGVNFILGHAITWITPNKPLPPPAGGN